MESNFKTNKHVLPEGVSDGESFVEDTSIVDEMSPFDKVPGFDRFHPSKLQKSNSRVSTSNENRTKKEWISFEDESKTVDQLPSIAFKSTKTETKMLEIDGSSEKMSLQTVTQNTTLQANSQDMSVVIDSQTSSETIKAMEVLKSPVIKDRDQWISFDIVDLPCEDSNSPPIGNVVMQTKTTPPATVTKSPNESLSPTESLTDEASSLLSPVKQKSTIEILIPAQDIKEESTDKTDMNRKVVMGLKSTLSPGGKFETVVATAMKSSSCNNTDTKALVIDDNDSNNGDSDIDANVVDLDHESDNEIKALRDTPVKKFPDVKLFQAKTSNLANSPAVSMKREHSASPIHETASDEDLAGPLDDYPDDKNMNAWQFLCRYPHQKKKLGSRIWIPVTVSVEGDFIKISGSLTNGSDVSSEIPLQPFFVCTVPKLHHGIDKHDELHCIKLQYVKYKERRRLKNNWHLEHIPVYMPVLKLGTTDYVALRVFVRKVESIIRTMPTYRDKGVTYRHDEIFIDCDDECHVLLSGTGKVLKHNSSVGMKIRAFISGHPELRMYLNDVRYQEKLTNDKKMFTSKSQQWMSPDLCHYHPCTDVLSSNSEGSILFTPPDGCSFELLRYRFRKLKSLPIVARSSLEIVTSNSLKISASIQAVGDHKSLRQRRNGVILYIPIPDSWAKFFMKSTSMAGKKQYLSAKTNSKNPSHAVAKCQKVSMKLSAGQARYEPAFGAIVWRLGSLPLLCSELPVDAEHTFVCDIELPFEVKMHEQSHYFSYVEFSMSHQVCSDIQVEEVLLSNARRPDKWVSYEANFSYKILMHVKDSGVEKS